MRLADLERARAAEKAEARRWAREHKLTDAEPESPFFGGAQRRVSVDATSFESVGGDNHGDTWAMWEQLMLRSGRDYNPLVGGTSLHTWKDRELRERMDHVMSFLSEADRDLLNARYVELLTFEELADRFPPKRGRRRRASYQAMQQRLKVALEHLVRAYAEHFEDDKEAVVEEHKMTRAEANRIAHEVLDRWRALGVKDGEMSDRERWALRALQLAMETDDEIDPFEPEGSDAE